MRASKNSTLQYNFIIPKILQVLHRIFVGFCASCNKYTRACYTCIHIQHLQRLDIFMKLTKKQINTLMILGGITVLLFLGIFLLPWVGPSSQASAPPYPPVEAPSPHNPFRNARTAVSPLLDWEINLGGSGTETVVAAFGLQQEILIFGNTTSTDYDFYNQVVGHFIILMTLHGTPISYNTYAGVLEQVIMLEDGFLKVVNTQTESLLVRTNAFGMRMHYVNLRSEHALQATRERIIYVYVDSFAEFRAAVGTPKEKFHAVIEYRNPLDDYRELRVDVVTEQLELSYSRFFRRALSLEFVRAFANQHEFRLFANVRGLNESVLTVYTWTRQSLTEQSFRNMNLPLINRYEIEDVFPAPMHGTYAALIRRLPDNVPFLIEFYNNFNRHRTIPLGGVSVQSTHMMAGRDMFYVFEYQMGDRGMLSRFGHSDMRNVDDIPIEAFSNFVAIDSHMVTHFGTVFSGRTSHTLSIVGTNHRGLVPPVRTFNANTIEIKTMIYVQNGIILIGESSGIGENVGEHFNATDIWVSKLLF